MSHGKRKRGEEEDVLVEEEIDRVSDLPDSILHHILSLVDTKSIARTSYLSKRWRSLWKDVPAINFKRSCFDSDLVFIEHVLRFMSFRSGFRGSVGRVNLDYSFHRWIEPPEIEAFDRIMRVAASHGGGHLQSLSLSIIPNDPSSFRRFAASIIAYRHHDYLTTLELSELRLTVPPSENFNLLTTLQLFRCNLLYKDPFADFPSLKYLKLIGCASSVNLEVRGLNLLELDIQWTNNVLPRPIEVSAPELKSFRFVGEDEGWKVFPKLDVPTLNHADIRLRWWNEVEFLHDELMVEANRACVRLLRGLHNVKSLILCFDNCVEYDVQHNSPFVGMKSLMEVEPSPFTRLETLKVQYKKGLVNMPYEVIRYFFEASRSKDKSFVLEKIG